MSSYTDVGFLGTAPLNAQAMTSITVSNPQAFTVIYAQYSGDANFFMATSDPGIRLLRRWWFRCAATAGATVSLR